MSESVFVLNNEIQPNPYQARLSEDPAAIEELAASIGRDGLMQIPTGRRVDGVVQLAFGHSRLAAYRLLASRGNTLAGESFESMPVIVRELTDLQMFELGLAENIKRRNLNPIEMARAMQRYMQEFHKTSEQTGEVFGVSAETVRGQIRLLNLPEEIQEKVGGGTLTIGTARKLLSVQAISPEAAIKAADKIVKGNITAAEDVDEHLEDAIRDRKDVIHMWDSSYAGEPRGGYDLWPLPWQHKGSLAALTEREIEQLLAAEPAEPAKGKRKKKGDSIAALVEIDMAAALTQLSAGMRLNADLYPGAEDAIDRLNQIADPPACADCNWYSRYGDDHYCALKQCWERKKAAWLLKEQARLSQELGIAVYDPKTDPEPVSKWQQTWGDIHNRFQALLQHKNTGLRLALAEDGDHRWGLPGTKNSRFMIVDLEKRTEAKKGQTDRTPRHELTPAEKRERTMQAKEAEKRALDAKKLDLALAWVKQEATPVFAKAFEGLKSANLLLQLSRFNKWDEGWKEFQKLTPPKKLQQLRVQLAWSLLDPDGDYDVIPGQYRPDSVLRKGPTAVAKYLEKIATEWGIKLPKNWLAVAKEWDTKEPEQAEEE